VSFSLLMIILSLVEVSAFFIKRKIRLAEKDYK